MKNNIILEVSVKESFGGHLNKIDRIKGTPLEVVKLILDKYVSTSVIAQMGELAAIDIKNTFKKK